MGSRYLTDLDEWCREAGLTVIEDDGWESRARGSGGFDGDRPWCVMWHHTASKTTAQNDVNYICRGSPDAPISNLYLARDGTVWICAAGATNTNGKGGPLPVSKGTVPLDQMNTHAVSIEAGNDGVGEPWPQAQIDAYFKLNEVLTRKLGLEVTDCCTHNVYAPDRKIDPATAAAVQGPWRPGSTNSSGTWSLSAIKDEAITRAGGAPPLPGPDPGPDPGPPIPFPQEDDMLVVALDANGSAWVGNGITKVLIGSSAVFDRYVIVWRERFVNTSGKQVRGWSDVGTGDNETIAALGVRLMGTWDGMKSVADDADDTISDQAAQISEQAAEIANLQAEKAELQRQLDECMAGHPDPGPPANDILLPPEGKIWLGVDAAGRSGYTATGAKLPRINHDYAKSGSDFAGDVDRCPAGMGPLENFKPNGQMGHNAYQAIINGQTDASIDQAAQAIKNHDGRMFFAPLHEPENDDDSGQYDDEYAEAFRYIVERVRSKGADPVVVWNMMGYYGHGARYDTLYPGDDVVDWIGSDPYVRTDTKVDTWAEFFNTPSGSFPGFYSWAAPKGKPFMLCEWGIGIAVASVVAPKLLSRAQLDVLKRDFPLVRALVYWNQVGTVDYRLQNFAATWKAFTEFPEFDA